MQFSVNTFNILVFILSFNILGTLAFFTFDFSGKILWVYGEVCAFFKQF